MTACVPGIDVIGAWKIVANNQTAVPGSTDIKFFSYNQPSINSSGLLVFRGRARGATGSGASGGSSSMSRGVFAVDACLPSPKIYTVADTSTPVPAPNNTDAVFTEFPSIPRIDMNAAVMATRGQSNPVWTLSDGTKLGTSGVYVGSVAGLSTGIGLLGGVPEFSYMQVPNARMMGLKFDQFPGSPTVSDGKYLAFKGNYTDTDTDGVTPISRTGVYYRDLSVSNSPLHVIADSSMLIPGTDPATTFGSTAPPSAANGHVAFVGLDNEDAPTAGGLYIAPLADKPALTALVQIGQTMVTDNAGKPMAGDPTFTALGEGLAFDGRYIAFWGAWGTETRPITLTCPTDGNADLIAACQNQYPPDGVTTKPVPVNQGIFLYDTVQKKLWMVARAGTGEQFQDFLYWVFSGSPGTTGSESGGGSDESGPTDAEPPRWRASAFAAVDGARGTIFKGSLTSAEGVATPSSGIYGAAFTGSAVDPVFKIAEVGDSIAPMDSTAPADSAITALGIERESLRGGWLTITASTLDPLGESWAGIYATYFPGAFHVNPAPDPSGVGTLVLGK
ncbi:MAG: hypothetical protein WCA17_02245 [Burkholderiales bacterium]